MGGLTPIWAQPSPGLVLPCLTCWIARMLPSTKMGRAFSLAAFWKISLSSTNRVRIQRISSTLYSRNAIGQWLVKLHMKTKAATAKTKAGEIAGKKGGNCRNKGGNCRNKGGNCRNKQQQAAKLVLADIRAIFLIPNRPLELTVLAMRGFRRLSGGKQPACSNGQCRRNGCPNEQIQIKGSHVQASRRQTDQAMRQCGIALRKLF